MDYDLIIVGGGIAGSALAMNMAEHGASVLVLEKEKVYRDRIRGEAMLPWGVSEAKTLGIFDVLMTSCGHLVNNWKIYFSGELFADRDLTTSCPYGVGALNFYHPTMQETLIELAQSKGVEVHRNARVSKISVSANLVEWTEAGEEKRATARLIVGSDGSQSTVRQLAGFEVCSDPDRLILAGVMIENCAVPDDSVHHFQGADGMAIFFPQGNSRTRGYVGFPCEIGHKSLTGDRSKSDYITFCQNYGVPEFWLNGATLSGPLAQFNCADSWVDHPAINGVVLIGDAAAKPDPSWGTGLSLSLMDVRTLRDYLLETTNWNQAVHEYAEDHDRYYQALRSVESWFTNLTWDQGPEADERRARLMPQMDTPGAPDIIGLGPESSTSESVFS